MCIMCIMSNNFVIVYNMHNMHNVKYVRCQLGCVGVTPYRCVYNHGIMSHLICGVKYRIKSARGIWLGLGV